MKKLSNERSDIITELMNIGFGKSVGILSEILGVFIDISVPNVESISSKKVLELLIKKFDNKGKINILQQAFRGRFWGEAIFVLPTHDTARLVSILGNSSGYVIPMVDKSKLELEAILEVGNVIIGSCLNQFASLLNTTLSFNPPQVFIENLYSYKLGEKTTLRKGNALVIHTNFQVGDEQMEGFLFVFLSMGCLEWLYDSIDNFISNLK